MITDPSFRRVPIRGVYTKSPTIDRRFKWVLYIKASSAPVDKRGKRIRRDNDFLKEYYRIGQEVDDEKKQNSEEDPSGDDEQSEAEQNLMALKAEEKQSKSEKKLAMNSDEEESDDDDDDESAESHDQEEEASEEVFEEDDEAALHEDSEPEIPEEEEIANIEKETHRLAIVNINWIHITAIDLYVVLDSFLKKDGRVLSVVVYRTKFGLERMNYEEMHMVLLLLFVVETKKKEENGDDGEEDKEAINERIREYEKSKFKYYSWCCGM